MCGIAGIIDLTGQRCPKPEIAAAMARAIVHRGPDEDGYMSVPRLAMASRRLSIVGLADGRQPISDESGRITVIFNGELFDYVEQRKALENRGHRFATHCDTEVIPHLWEEQAEATFERLRGQFAIALWDDARQELFLARDRFGICPLYWTRRTSGDADWVLFASEIKALLASRLVPARPDLRGLDQIFTFLAMPGPRTAFEGIQLLPPGHFLKITPAAGDISGSVQEQAFWRMSFPDRGQEERGAKPQQLVDRFEEILLGAVERRLRADVPVVSYLSGGVDSSTVVALAGYVRKQPIPTFTIRIDRPDLDETAEAGMVAQAMGAKPTVVHCGALEVLSNYPRLIVAAESPVVDTSCAALLLLAEEVHGQGFKVALTGEGADEWLAGYPWYKIHRVLGALDVVPGVHLSRLLRRLLLEVTGAPRFPWSATHRIRQAAGGDNPWSELYGLMGLSRSRYYSAATRAALGAYTAYEDLVLDRDAMRRWHWVNRGLYLGARVHLGGLLLSGKGDRVAMHSSVETRYPFLDEEVFDFLAPLPPRWKLHGFTEKYLLRLLAERWLPKAIAWRRKAMFRAPFDSFHGQDAPPFVEQLLSTQSLAKTGYFDPRAVHTWRAVSQQLGRRSLKRTALEMGLVAVISTQLWHHTFIDGTLADLPSWQPPAPADSFGP